MCDVMTALAVGGGLSSYFGGQSAANAQADAAEENLKSKYAQTAEKQNQINESSNMEQAERIKQGMIDRAEARAIAGESGALGYNSDRLMADSFMQQGTDLQSIELNRKNQIKQENINNKSYQAQAQSAVNNAYSNAPGLIDTGLQVGTNIYTAKQLEKQKTLSS